MSILALPYLPLFKAQVAPSSGGPDPLSALRDIHLPEPVSLWPPAIGWWVLAMAVIVIVAIALGLWLQQRRRNRYRRIALTELQQSLSANADCASKAISVMSLLKRVALRAYPDLNLAPYSGERWYQFLTTSMDAKADSVLEELLSRRLYRSDPVSVEDLDKLAEFAHRWLRQHVSAEHLALPVETQ